MASSRAAAIVVLAFGLIAGLSLLAFQAPSTFPGADLAVYRAAGNDLLAYGDPYRSAASQPYAFQYRYPPLLAMLMPVLGWPPVWYGLLVGATMLTFLIGLRQAGIAYLFPVWVLGGAWGQTLLNGNVQGVVVALLAVVPFRRRTGAVALAVATMLKLHPVLGVVWYLGRRDWLALRWYLGAIGVLLVVQAPWLSAFVHYYTTAPSASPFGELGFGLRAIHPVVWVAGALVCAVAAFRFANTRGGWLLATLLQLAALPRVLLATLSLVLAAPLPTPAETPKVVAPR